MKRILWMRSTIIDLFLDKAAEMEILQHLADRGNDVHLFAAKSKNRLRVFDQLVTHPDIHLTLFPLRNMPRANNFLLGIVILALTPFLVLTKRPDFIIVEPGPSTICFAWKPLFSLLKCKVVLDIRSTPVFSEWSGAGLETSAARTYASSLFNISVTIARKTFDGMTILTASMRKEVCDRFLLDPKAVGVWTMGVSTTLFNPEGYDKKEIRRELDLDDKFVVFYHGVFGLQRGIVESVKSIKTLGGNYKDIVLFLLGKGAALPVLRNFVSSNGLRGRVIIHDAVDYSDVPKYIAACDVGIVPLPDLAIWRYQCPQKLLEYLAMKKVAIITDIPAHREVVGTRECGIYVSSSDPNEIAEAAKYAHENKDRLKEWGLSGRAIIDERYSWKTVAEDLDNYLNHLPLDGLSRKQV